MTLSSVFNSMPAPGRRRRPNSRRNWAGESTWRGAEALESRVLMAADPAGLADAADAPAEPSDQPALEQSVAVQGQGDGTFDSSAGAADRFVALLPYIEQGNLHKVGVTEGASRSTLWDDCFEKPDSHLNAGQGGDAGTTESQGLSLSSGSTFNVSSIYVSLNHEQGGEYQVAAGDINNDGTPDIIVAVGSGAPSLAPGGASFVFSDGSVRFAGDGSVSPQPDELLLPAVQKAPPPPGAEPPQIIAILIG